MPVLDASYLLPPAFQVGSLVNVGNGGSSKRAMRRLFGADKKLSLSGGLPVRVVTTSGDHAICEAAEALRQWVILCVITNPGEWALLPTFGVGARQYVKARSSKASRDELEQKTRAQLLTNPRIDSAVVAVKQADHGITMSIYVTPKARDAGQFGLLLELT